MGTAALAFGIIALIISFVPLCGMIALIPALFGILFGIIDVIIKLIKKIKIGVPVVGIILSFLSIAIMCAWIFVGYKAFEKGDLQNELKKISNDIQVEIEEENK